MTMRTHTIKRRENGSYIIIRPNGKPLRDGMGVTAFVRAEAAAEFCRYVGLTFEWLREDWPGLIREIV